MKEIKKRPSDWDLVEALGTLKEVPARDPVKIKAGKDTFMFEAAKLRKNVSLHQKSRHTGWNPNLFSRKEPLKMTTFGTIILAISLILGGSGITAVSAQGSLPDSALYPVKLLTEDIQFGLTTDPLAKWELSVHSSEQRLTEIRMMLANGAIPSEPVLQRLETRLTQTLQLASSLGEPLATQALAQTRARLETQTQLMLQTQVATPQGQAVMARVQEMIEECIRQAQTGQEDPLQLQQQIQQQLQEQQQIQQQLQEQQQNQQQYQTGTPSGTQSQYQTPQMPEKTKTPMACSGQGQCGNNPK
jgi:hypothetical protein